MAHLLIIDDDAAVLDIHQQVAEFQGHTVATATNGLQGLEVLMTSRPEPDVIFVNGAMPVMNGIDFLRAARPLVRGRIPCVFDSAYEAKGEQSLAAREAGAVAHLVRPWDLGQYQRLLERALQVRALYRCSGLRPPIDTGVASRLLARCHRGGGLEVQSPREAWRCLSLLVALPSPEPGCWVPDERIFLESPRDALWDGVWRGLTADGDAELHDSSRGSLLLLDLAVVELEPRSGRFAWDFPNGARIHCRAPETLNLGRLHGAPSAEEPVAAYQDGFRVFMVHGAVVPPRLIEKPESVTLGDIRTQSNAEVRRWLRERYGQSRYLVDTRARVVDVDTVPVDVMTQRGPTLTRALLEDNERRRWLVASDGSTRRVYHMEVPRGCSTCRDAYVALSGRPGVRTIVEA